MAHLSLASFRRNSCSYTVVSDNASNAILKWQEVSEIYLSYMSPSKPMQVGFVESFSGRICGEYLNWRLVAARHEGYSHKCTRASLDGSPSENITSGQ